MDGGAEGRKPSAPERFGMPIMRLLVRSFRASPTEVLFAGVQSRITAQSGAQAASQGISSCQSSSKFSCLSHLKGESHSTRTL
ncbi:hypothetical protein SV7mr_49660 [Stieleria bergensis]|uniref:Uncharacterized protein n=1 Tax=Stieleria bergensis TaxID=2528025 RepID=A0A517T223_9BACT|nr:hypothetical protein SV7mr_49660 [Planctomycetes bacterium SV_7m_r]